MDEAQFQQLLNAVLAAQANVQPAPPVPPVPPPAAPFALTPGQANPTQPLDYTSTIGIKIWNEATASLPLKFNVEGKEVNQFCRDLQVRAKQQGWDATGADIITVAADANTTYNVITEYGRLTVEQITTAAQTYVADQTRQAQNNEQMLHCIDNSLTKEGKLKILAEQDKYTITVGGVEYESATLLLKLLMQKGIVDTRATASFFRENLSSLDTHMATVNSDIEKFNEYVKVNAEGLKARGERCDDLMINLFKGYLSVSDREFVRYMQQKKDNYDDGEDMSPESLQTLALNKYDTLTKQDKWNAKSAEQKQIVALTAEMNKIKDVNLRLAQSIKSKRANTTDGTRSQGNSTTSNQKQNEAWKKVAPKAGEPLTKQRNNKTYHWCDEHPAWVIHHPDNCELKKKRLEQQKEKESTSSENEQSQRVSYSAALTTIMEELEQEDQE